MARKLRPEEVQAFSDAAIAPRLPAEDETFRRRLLEKQDDQLILPGLLGDETETGSPEPIEPTGT
jgi:hypothetical protein